MNEQVVGGQIAASGGAFTAVGHTELERRLLTRRESRRASTPLLEARPGRSRVVSFGQERMWLLEQMGAAIPVNNCAFTIRLRGRLNVDALRRGLATLQLRHEILRTVYTVEHGSLVQSVLPEPCPLRYEDLTPSGDALWRARGFAVEEINRPFALDRDWPARWTLLRVGEDDHVLVICLHHIATDGWSESIFNRELSELYAAFRAGRPSPLPELPVQYADFASWQRAQAGDPAVERSLEYWRRNLAGAAESVRLPFDRQPRADSGFTGAAIDHHLDARLVERIKDLARRERGSSFMVLLAAFAVLLNRCSGQEDIVIGTPVAGRALPEVEVLIGFFVNTLPLRLDLTGMPSFRTLLRRVRRTVLDSYPHQHLPFDRVVQEIAPARLLGRQRLVQVMFQLHNTPAEELSLEGLEAELEQIFPDASALDLAVAFDPTGVDLRGLWAFRDELFDEATIRMLQRHYVRVLDHLVAFTDTPIGAAPLAAPNRNSWSHG